LHIATFCGKFATNITSHASTSSLHNVLLFFNKKFELMLTRRAKAYSSSCSQTVSLFFSHFAAVHS